MKDIKMNKLTLVETPGYGDGVVAFQQIEFVVNFYGNEISEILDTKIMADGSQYVIDGNGFIPDGYKVA